MRSASWESSHEVQAQQLRNEIQRRDLVSKQETTLLYVYVNLCRELGVRSFRDLTMKALLRGRASQSASPRRIRQEDEFAT